MHESAIDDALAEWRQGDVVGHPLDLDLQILDSNDIALVVLTQTCDLRRAAKDRP